MSHFKVSSISKVISDCLFNSFKLFAENGYLHRPASMINDSILLCSMDRSFLLQENLLPVLARIMLNACGS